MLAVEKILVPVDFSEYSNFLVEHALGFAALSPAEVVVLHVWPRPLNPSGATGRRLTAMGHVDHADHADRTLREADKQMAALLAQLSLSDQNTLSKRLIPGDPWQAIVEEARSGRFDLIVMGNHGRGGPSQLFLGSVAEKVMRHAPCPVLTVPWPGARQERRLEQYL